MFGNCYTFEGKGLENWDVSNVMLMQGVFWGCKKFNCDLSNWNVHKVENTQYMFADCKTFNCDLSNWNVSNVKDMSHMFDTCTSLKKLKNIPSWYKK